MISSEVPAGLAANKAPSGQVDVSAVEAAAITAAVTGSQNTQNNKKTPPVVSAVQVVDPKAGVTTSDPLVKQKYMGQKLNWIFNK